MTALLSCEACEAPVSVEAKRCPQCGARTPYGRRQERMGMVLFVIVVGLVLLIGARLIYVHNAEKGKRDACRDIQKIVQTDCP